MKELCGNNGGHFEHRMGKQERRDEENDGNEKV